MSRRNQTVQPKRTFAGALGQIIRRNPADEEIHTGRQENVLMGHPEACGIYTQGYDNRDQYLGSSPRRMDFDYVGPEGMRIRSKNGG